MCWDSRCGAGSRIERSNGMARIGEPVREVEIPEQDDPPVPVETPAEPVGVPA